MNYADELRNRGYEFEPADDGQIMIVCPFHDDHNPSLTVNVEEGVFHCFSCKESGGFPKLLAQLEGISLEDAWDQLEEGQVDEDVWADIQRKLTDALTDINDPMSTYTYYSTSAFHKFFPPINKTGLKYLEGRGISRKTATLFDLRWGASGQYKNRVVFPIYTSEGKLWSYGGRAVSKKARTKTMKVRKSRENLYGLWELITDKQKEQFPYLIIVEGEFDAMYLQQMGYSAVSVMGSGHLTDGQLHLLRKHARLTIACYDGDKAGREAQDGTKKREGTVEILRRFMPTLSVTLPEGTDPNQKVVDGKKVPWTKDELRKIFRSVL